MEYYNTKKRYCPHQIQTKIKTVELFRKTHDIDYVMRRYHVSRASVYRWNKQYDGTRESLENKSHKPKTPHPNAHTEQELNCRHSAFPIIMGVSKPAYTEEELKNIDPPPFTYQGRTYTAYQAQQQMRKMERAMRKQKDRYITADAAGDKDTFTAASIKLRRQKDIYEDFCKAAGTYTEYERTFVQNKLRKKQAIREINANMPLVDGIFFEIHGSKLKPDPSEIASQAARPQ